MGLPLLGTFGNDRSASIPTLQAILRGPAQASVAEDTNHPVRSAAIAPAKIRGQSEKAVVNQPESPTLLAGTGVAAASIREAKAPAAAPEVTENVPIAGEQAPPAVAPGGEAAVMSTDQESSWSVSVAKAARESEEKARDERVELERANEAEAVERSRLEQAERSRAAEQIAVARAEALELKRAEERREEEKAEQLALIKAREEALELKRSEEAKRQAEQAALARAREEALAKLVEAEARALQEQRLSAIQTDRAAEGKNRSDERDANNSARPATPNAEGKQKGVAAPQLEKGAELAGRAVEQARSSPRESPASQPANNDRQRRGSILGSDPKDIQLAFYGEGWRQKVERIGSLNYPKLSRNLRYDPLLVTVSINSDGTLAGVRIEKSSGHPELDDAVRRIVEMSAPFAAFPPALKRSYDVVDITRSWNFLEERPRIYGQ